MNGAYCRLLAEVYIPSPHALGTLGHVEPEKKQ